MHESTVSRVTTNKYLLLRRGLFELKYFFTSGVAVATGGEGGAAEAVKAEISELIEAEETGDPQRRHHGRAAEGKGFDLARRTVAKYREAMGIGIVDPAPAAAQDGRRLNCRMVPMFAVSAPVRRVRRGADGTDCLIMSKSRDGQANQIQH